MYVHQRDHVFQHAHGSADDRENGAFTAAQTATAQYRRGDGVQLIKVAEIYRLRGLHHHKQHTAEAREQ